MFAFLYQTGGPTPSTLSALQQALSLPDVQQQRYQQFGPVVLIANLWREATDVRRLWTELVDGWLIAAWARLDQPQRLQRALGLPATTSDAELLARYWLRHGDAGLRDLYGDFQLLAWHGERQQLHLAVDHLASQHLFYVAQDGLLLASPVRSAVLAHPAVSKQLNLTALATLVTTLMPEADPWSAIQHVPAGHVLHWAPGQPARPQRWWQPPDHFSVTYRDPRDYAAAATEGFAASMAPLLAGHEPLATTLSGGLDSSLVTAWAASELGDSGRALHAYTSVPQSADYQHLQRPNWDIDEWPLTQQLAARYPRLQHHAICAGSQGLLDKLAQQSASSGNPLRNTANYHWLESIYRAARAQGCTRLLTGGKGNASLSYAGHGGAARLLAQGHYRWAWQHLHAKGLTRRAGLRTLVELLGLLPAWQAWRQGTPTAQIPFGLDPACLQPAYREQVTFLRTPSGSLSWAERINFLIKPRALYGPNPLWQFGLHMVDPFANRALIELLLSFPPEASIGLGHERLLARLAGEGKVPDSIRWRTRRGEQAPDEALWIGEQAAHYQQVWQRLRDQPLVCTLFDPDWVSATLQRSRQAPLPRLTASTVHRILDIALFIEQATQRWDATLGHQGDLC